MSEIKGCMNCGNISCKNNKKRECKGCGRWKTPEQRILELEEKVGMAERTRDRLISIGFPTFASCKEYAAKLKELEAEVKEWKDKADLWCKTANLKDHNIMINKELEKENAELKAFRQDCIKLTEDNVVMARQRAETSKQLTKAREIILRLYNAGRDVLMCRAEEKAYDNLSNAINDKSIEQFLSEVGK
jgi:hypothetical protein